MNNPGSNGSTRAPLRIGFMMRGVDEVDGMGVMLRGLCDKLFEVDQTNQYVLFYRNDEQAGRWAKYPNVTERVVRFPSKLLWDQIAMPWVAWRERLDVLFHHKFTVPLIAPCPTVVQQAGAEYWTHPQWYETIDRIYATRMIPLYCKRAAAVLTMSESLANQLGEYAALDLNKTDVLYTAPDPKFHRIEDRAKLDAVREKYSLPSEPFFLMVAKGYASIYDTNEEEYPRKNVGGSVEAYRQVQERRQECPPLVVAGPGFHGPMVERHRKALPRPDLLHFPGLVDHDDMPALYNLSSALVFTSYSESFGIPLVEAMACGVPLIAANTASCPEIADSAGLLVDPYDSNAIAEAMDQFVVRPDLVSQLRERALKRAADFTWESSCDKLLDVLRQVTSKTVRAA